MNPAPRPTTAALFAVAAIFAGAPPTAAAVGDTSGAIALSSSLGCDGTARVPTGGLLPLRLRIGEPSPEGAGLPDAARVDLAVVDAEGRRRTMAERALVPHGLTHAFEVPIDGPPGPWWLEARSGGHVATCAFAVSAARGPRLEAPRAVSLDVPDRAEPPVAARVARRAVALRNRGDAPLRVWALGIAGGDGSGFDVVADAPLPLVVPPGGTRDVLLRFERPAEAASRDGAVDTARDVLVIRTDDPLGPSVGVPLRAASAGARREPAMTTARGCLETGDLPVWFAGEAVTPRAASDGRQRLLAARGDRLVAVRGGLVATADLRAVVAAPRGAAMGDEASCGLLVAAPVARLSGAVRVPAAIGDGDAGVEGLTVVLSGPAARETRTGPGGAFAFDVAVAGRYVVTAIPPAGHEAVPARVSVAASDLGRDLAPLAVALEPATAGPPAPDQQACTVAIAPRDGVVNVGQPMSFRATASPTRATFAYRWTIEGDAIRDYSEGTAAAWRTMPLVPSDLDDRTVAFYWRPDDAQRHPRNEGPMARRVRVDVAVAGGGTCFDEVVLQVERNETSSTRQAEDWYTTNHDRFIQREHALWHDRYPFEAPFYDGAIFFDFHAQFTDRFNRWRAEFGYPPIGLWDPGTPIPAGADIDHRPRGATFIGRPRPGWATLTGGGIRGWNLMPCDVTRGGQRVLSDFPRDRRLLGCAVTETWHNDVHNLIAGDMQDPPTSPRDPVFWRWHRFADLVSRDRLALWQAELAADGVRPADERILAPPRPAVVYQVPFRLFDHVVDLTAVDITFDVAVEGVTASALTVGGRAATEVSGSGAGPYRFSGHGIPTGRVTVRLDGRAIRGRDGGVAQDAEWTQTVLDPAADLDGDGLTNGDEIALTLSRPDAADSDADGLDDAAEWSGGTLARWQDTDGDGAADGCELASGSDPRDARDAAAGCDPVPVWACSAGAAGPRSAPSPAALDR